MSFLVEFLNHVLPSEGYYCWWFKKDNFPQQGFVSTIEELATTLQRIDAAGHDAYFACSTFKTTHSRKGENVHLAQSHWLDIDAGPGKPYPDAEAACAALDQFCDALQLPYPTVVYSGGGIHAYWRNETPLDVFAWAAIAERLKQCAARMGLFTDPSRTADSASILRPPGTYNYKIPNTPRPVECLELLDGGIATIFQTQNDNGQSQNFAGSFGADEKKNLTGMLNFNKDAGAIYQNSEPSYASQAANHCLQLRSFRDTRGNISEPVWYAALGVLAHCADGDQLSQEWSAGHPSYSAEETARKLVQARNASGPSTCERFKQLHPAGCVGCLFNITSPISLGRTGSTATPVTTETFPELMKGYELDQFYQLTTTIDAEDKEGKPIKKRVVINRWPIYLSEVRDGETERNQGLLFRQWEPDRGWYEIEVPIRDYEGSTRWGILGYHGINIADASRQYFKQYVHRCWGVLSGGKKMRYDQFGWKNNFADFYLGDMLYKGDGTRERCASSRDAALRGAKMQTTRTGSLANWTAAANKFFMSGCEAISYALLSGGFASPLMPFITPEGEGGAVLSLLSPGSGTGKSTVLTGIASVWGDLEALRLTMRDTENSRFRVIATLCNLPVICDELRDVDPEVPTKMIAAFTVGRDKLRARQDGTVNPSILSWKLLFVSASNKSLVDALQKNGDDPLSARVFEIETTPPKDVVYSFTNQLSNELILNQGFAGRAYINYLLQPGVIDWVRRNLYSLAEKYGKDLDARPPHRFIIRQLAATAVAMHIVRKMGLIEFDERRIMEWGLEEASRAIRGIMEFDPLNTLASIINQFSSTDMVVVENGFHAKRIEPTIRRPTRGVHMRREIATGRLFISADFIKNELIKRGQSWTATARILEQKQILLERSRQIALGAGTADVITAKTACWLIDMTNPLIGELVVKEVLPFQAKAV